MNKKKIAAGAIACIMTISVIPGAYGMAAEYEQIDEQSGMAGWEESTSDPVDEQSGMAGWEENTSDPIDEQNGMAGWEENSGGEMTGWEEHPGGGMTGWEEHPGGGMAHWETEATGNWSGGVTDWEEEYYGEPEYYEEETYIEYTESEGTLYRKSEERLLPEDYEIPGIEEAEKAFKLDEVKELPDYMELEVPNILQKPLLPTGCESVSLTMALQYEGIDIGKDVVAGDYLIYNHQDDNMALGYVGDPYSEEGAGCFAPAIAMTAQEIFLDQELEYDAYDITDSELEDLLKYVSLGTPVVIWTTMYMAEPEFTREDCEYNGRVYRWYRQEHCVVLSGYDLNAGTLQINDPLEGIVTRDMEAFERIYVKTGKNAVVLKEREEENAYGETEEKEEEEMSIQEMWLAEQAALEMEKETAE